MALPLYVSAVTVKVRFDCFRLLVNSWMKQQTIRVYISVCLSPSNLGLYNNTSAKQELFATDIRLLLMYIRGSNECTNQRRHLFTSDAFATFLGQKPK